jgi:CRP/FNR family cyclic AMP-dependent transcriptional regulator
VSVSAEAWARLGSAGRVRRHDPGVVLLRQGDPATHVLALVAGRVKVLRTSSDGNVLVLAVRGPGEILGDISVLGGEDRSATVITVDQCETRLMRTLLRLATPGPAMPVDVGLDQTELGQAAGLSRSTVAVELARLRDQGVIATARRRIVITDLSRLRALAESGHGNV